MFTFGFWVRTFFSGFLLIYITANIASWTELEDSLILKILYWVSSIIMYASIICVVISVFGIIWKI